MNRSTFILGFAMLVIAATLAASITMRNAPGNNRMTTRPDVEAPRTAQTRARAQTSTTRSSNDSSARPSRNQGATNVESIKVDSLRVALPEPWLATLPKEQQVAWRDRTATVDRAARKKLDHLTTELDLTFAQREKMFPLIARSTLGYDPLMLISGNLSASNLSASTALTADEEIHQVLDSQQQALVEDEEVNRQLWWQDTLSRLEAELIDSTGGVTATIIAAAPEALTEAPITPAETTPTPAERIAPAAREDGNLFDLFGP